MVARGDVCMTEERASLSVLLQMQGWSPSAGLVDRVQIVFPHIINFLELEPMLRSFRALVFKNYNAVT